jgi:hypothetical protein
MRSLRILNPGKCAKQCRQLCHALLKVAAIHLKELPCLASHLRASGAAQRQRTGDSSADSLQRSKACCHMRTIARAMRGVSTFQGFIFVIAEKNW